jgi:threonylcarbamoyladenosine tRNA methylthiotransferase MtaB
MKVSFDTLGCKINQFYTNCLEQKHIKEGDKLVSLEGNPDIAYINTCAVTARAGSESRKLYRKAKKNAGEVRVLGCQAKLFPEEFKEKYFIEERDLIDKEFETISSRARPYVPIQFGCDNFCSYCIVPYARGKSYSLPDDQIIKNVEEFIEKGYKEIVLTGIHIGNYRYKKIGLKELLKELLNLNIRIRLTSIMPDCFDEDFISLFSEKNLMPHVHISQQSGSNKILEKMKRRYTREKTIWLADKLREKRDDIRLAGDFIAGFPGETNRDFEDTVNLIKKAEFSHLHIFRYSPRPYTLASLYPGKVHDYIKKERADKLKRIGKIMRAEFIKKNIGKVYKVIVEDKSHLGEKYLTGITPNYIKIHFKVNNGKRDLIPVKICKFEKGIVYGKTEK